MKKKSLLLAAVAASLSLFGFLLYLPLTGCNGEPPCCAKSVSLGIMPEYICDPQKFPEGNTITVSATIEYAENGKPCTPKKYSVTLLEDNQKITPPKVTKNGPYYQIPPFARTVTKSVWYELTAFCDSEMKTDRKQVKIISEKPEWSTFRICTSSPEADHRGLGIWDFPSTKKYGKGIVIQTVENLSKYEVEVRYGSLPAYKIKPGDVLNAYDGQPAGNGWQIGISRQDYDDYLKNKEDICLKIQLRCQPG